jgi:hypothetical protein
MFLAVNKSVAVHKIRYWDHDKTGHADAEFLKSKKVNKDKAVPVTGREGP